MGIMFACVFLYGFVGILTLIGVINVISTMSTSVKMRTKEFAVLRSMGMTSEELTKMLNVESIICAGKSLLYGLPLGLILVILVQHKVKMAFAIEIGLPWVSIIMVVFGVLALIWGTIRITAKGLKDQNMVETIRRACY